MKLVRIFVFCAFVFFNGVYCSAQAFSWNKIVVLPNYIKSIETTNKNMVAGEYTSNITSETHNGIFISWDGGENWVKGGLPSKGITDLKFKNGTLYASAYYKINNETGLYVSNDYGQTWEYKGMGFSVNTISADNESLYLGSFVHGLWVSDDKGDNWVQKIGNGWFGPKIDAVFSSDEITLAASENKVYITKDRGNAWIEVSELAEKGIRKFYVDEEAILAGSISGNGLYLSKDLGITWQSLSIFEGTTIEAVSKFGNLYYAGVLFENGERDIVEFAVSSPTLDRTGLQNIGVILELGFITKDQNSIFALINNRGVFTSNIAPNLTIGTFRPPWNIFRNNELFENITAYFDHEYPTLGSYLMEPPSTISTIINFKGIRGKAPKLYYSSHNGTDFKMNYEDNVYAVESGIANYYYCTDCGNSIKVAHDNGFQSTYMHLMKNDLITTNSNGNVAVSKGQSIGKVGMTGKSSGPHLHLSVTKDVNANGSFSDDFPNGNVDPFGWQTVFTQDPWPKYAWERNQANLNGTQSTYLWEIPYDKLSKTIKTSSETLIFDNVTANISNNSEQNVTFNFEKNGIPYKEFVPQTLRYIPQTSLYISAYDYLNESLSKLPFDLEIVFDLNSLDLDEIALDSLGMYYFDSNANKWQLLPTIVDLIENKITSQIPHLSEFAMFGTRISSGAPVTTLESDIDIYDGWLSAYPTISFENNMGVQVFYSVNEPSDLERYIQPVKLEKDGVNFVYFRSMASNGDIEETQTQMIKIDTKGIIKDLVVIQKTGFELN